MMRRVQVSLARLKWQRSYNRVLASVLQVVLVGVLMWGFLFHFPRERVVIQQSTGATRDIAAETFAQRFAVEWMTVSGDSTADRGRLAESFGGDGAFSNVSLVPRHGFVQRIVGSLVVQSFQLDGSIRRVVVSVTTSRGETMFIAVTVGRHGDGSLGLIGQPAIVGQPLEGKPIRVPDGGPVDDPALEAVVTRATRNYVEGRMDDLSADLDPSAVVSLPSVPLVLAGRPSLRWSDAKKSVYVIVDVTDRHGTRMQLHYEFGVRNLGRWVVTQVHTRPEVPA